MSRPRRPMPRSACLVAFAPMFLAGCDFDPTAALITEPVRHQSVVVDDPDRLHAVQGRTCTGVDPVSSGTVGIVEDTLQVPEWANQATVFLNGWLLRFHRVDRDRNVAGFGATLGDVARADGLLTWQATAVIGDKRLRHDYLWCYHYTAIAWNGALIDATPAYLAAGDVIEVEDLVDLSTEFADGNSTALKARFHRVDMRGTGPAAVLPMGFGLKWAKSDRKLLQAAYNLDAPSRFLEAGRRYFEGEPGVEFSQANSRSITWVSESSVDGFLGTGSQHQAVLSGLEECVC